MDKLIITAAVTGGEFVSKKTTPYVPSTVEEMVAEVVASVDAGASVVHLHAKNPETGEPWIGDPNPIFRGYIEAIRDEVDVVINATTGGGRIGNPPEVWDQLVEERCKLGAEIMSLNMGTMNMWLDHPVGEYSVNTPKMIERWAGYMVAHGVKPEHEVYDTGMINGCKVLYENGVITDPLHVQFVMVGKTGFLPNPRVLQYCLDQIPEDWTWSVCGIGRDQIPLAALGTVMGGHVRVGFEDNIYLRKGVLAESNAQLVEKVANIAGELERPVAKPKDARGILGLKSP